MSNIGQSTAADKRVSNNHLVAGFNPTGISEREVMEWAMRASEETSQMEAAIRASLETGAPTKTPYDAPTAPTRTPYDAPTSNDGEDETPAVVVSTREGISKKRVTGRGQMSKVERRSSAMALKALLRPLEAAKKITTPERVDAMMGLAEDYMDMEE